MNEQKTIVCAHRGASGLVKYENTIDAFNKAIEVGADSIECDVRKTKDNVIVISHNDNVFGNVIKDYTYQELLDKTSKDGYHLPTLKEALLACKNKILIDIEIKEEGYESEIVAQIEEILKTNEFNIRCFYDNSLIEVKKIDPNIFTVLLLGKDHPSHPVKTRLSEIFPGKRISKTGCNAISPYFKLVMCNYMARAHKKNCPVYTWTVKEKDTKELLIQMIHKKHVDGVITNYPDIAIEVRDNK